MKEDYIDFAGPLLGPGCHMKVAWCLLSLPIITFLFKSRSSEGGDQEKNSQLKSIKAVLGNNMV